MKASHRAIAEKLYELGSDMDWLDYEDTREDDINTLEKALDELEKEKDTEKYWALYTALTNLCNEED